MADARELDVHHISRRGMGGSKKLDVPENLIGLHRSCHADADNNLISEKVLRERVLGILKARNGKKDNDTNESPRLAERKSMNMDDVYAQEEYLFMDGAEPKVESMGWLAELRSEEESMMTCSPLNEEDQSDFDEPMAKVSIIAPQRVLVPMIKDLFG